MSPDQVTSLKSTVQWLHDLGSACKTLCSRTKSFGGYQVPQLMSFGLLPPQLLRPPLPRLSSFNNCREISS